jgi:hypothetical protein
MSLDKDETEKPKRFTHGVDVIVKTGMYKGYLGEVREFLPGSVEMLIEDRKFIELRGPREIGEVIQTDTGKCTIMSFRPTKDPKGKSNKYVYLASCENNVILSLTDVDIKGDRGSIKNVKVLKNIKNRKGRVINIKYPKLRVNVITSSGQIETSYDVKDVFYKDIMLKNGNFFQVKTVFADGMFGTERDNKSRLVIDKRISNNEIKEYLSGFKILSKEVEKDEVEQGPELISEQEEPSEEESEEEEGEGEFEESEEPEEGADVSYEDTGRTMDESEQLTSGYRDMSRTERMETSLTEKQIDYRNTIEKILNKLGYQSEIVNVYDIINEIDIIKEIIQKRLLAKDITNWVSFDEKCIILCLVLYSLSKEIGLNKSFNQIIELLNAHNYFYAGNFTSIIRDSIFLRSDWDELLEKLDKEMVKRLNRAKNYVDIIKIAMRNSDRFLQGLLNTNVKLDNIVPMPELIPVRSDYKETKKTMVNIEDVLRGDIPSSAKRIYWNPKYEAVFVKEWKDYLRRKADQADNSLNKELYEFVLESFDSAPMVINKLNEKVDTILKLRSVEYTNQINKCDDKRCKDDVTDTFVKEMVTSKVGGLTDDEYITLLRYTELKRIFGIFLEKVPTKVGHSELMRSIRSVPKKREYEQLEKRREEIMKEKELLRKMSELGMGSEKETRSSSQGKKRTRFEKIMSELKEAKRRMIERSDDSSDMSSL